MNMMRVHVLHYDLLAYRLTWNPKTTGLVFRKNGPPPISQSSNSGEEWMELGTCPGGHRLTPEEMSATDQCGARVDRRSRRVARRNRSTLAKSLCDRTGKMIKM